MGSYFERRHVQLWGGYAGVAHWERPVDVLKPKMSRELVGWVLKMRSEGKQDQVFDPILRGKGFDEEMLQVLDVACMCVSQNPFKRPTVKEVVEWLNNVGANRRNENKGF